jgi:putative transposase
MIDSRAVRVAISPTPAQERYLFSCATLSRKVYNWGLDRATAHHRDVVKPAKARGEKVHSLSWQDLSREWTQVCDSVVPWHDECPRYVSSAALSHLGTAYNNFFRRWSEGKRGKAAGFPRFKARNGTEPSFALADVSVTLDGRLLVPGLPGASRVAAPRGPDKKHAGTRNDWSRAASIACCEDPWPRLAGRKYNTVTFSYDGVRWYASFTTSIEVADPVERPLSAYPIVGIDAGLLHYATGSDGRVIANPRFLSKSLPQLRAMDRHISRQRNAEDGTVSARTRRRREQARKKAGEPRPTKAERREAAKAEAARVRGARAERRRDFQERRDTAIAAGATPEEMARIREHSVRMEKAQMCRRVLHARVRDARADFIHNLTTMLVRNYGVIVLEGLAVGNMLKNRKLARHIADAAWGEFRHQMQYKAELAGVEVIIADRFFPSSKTCSRCGLVKEEFPLSERVFLCAGCGLSLDRDLNAAYNLAQLGRAVAARRRGAISRDLVPHVPVKREAPDQHDSVT